MGIGTVRISARHQTAVQKGILTQRGSVPGPDCLIDNIAIVISFISHWAKGNGKRTRPPPPIPCPSVGKGVLPEARIPPQSLPVKNSDDRTVMRIFRAR